MRRPAVAIAFALACARPQAGVGLSAPVAAPIEYADAVARVARRQAADDSVVVSGGRSILMTHGQRTPRVFVLLHGFTDLPTQFEVVGANLFAAGGNVYIPRLPHHGERQSPVRALGRVHESELASFGDSVVDVARGLGDSVVLVGLSAGGAIAARMAQSRADVRRAVLIAPAIGAGLLSDDDARILLLLAPRLPEVTRTNAPIDSTRPDYLQGISTHGLAQVLRLGLRVRDEAEETAPGLKDIVFLLNERDQTVSEQAALDLAQRWFDHGARVTVYRFPDSVGLPHNLMEEPQRGGNPAIVFPVVEALARATPPPPPAELHWLPCDGWRCTLRKLLM